jgi:hypothetical protein
LPRLKILIEYTSVYGELYSALYSRSGVRYAEGEMSGWSACR